MKKEVLFAILLGLGVGLVVTVGVIRARRSLKSELGSDTNPTLQNSDGNSTSTNLQSPPTSVGITLFSPEDESVVTTKQLTVAGQTYPEAVVTVFVNQRQFSGKADREGHFSVAVTLDFGGNLVSVFTLDAAGKEGRAERFVTFYDKILEENILEAPATPSPTASASVRPRTTSATPKASPSAKPTPTPKP